MTTTKYANTYTKIRHAGIMTDYSLMNKGMALPECLCETKAKPAIKENEKQEFVAHKFIAEKG